MGEGGGGTLNEKVKGCLLAQNIHILKKEGNVLFNDALNTFNYGYITSGIW